MQTHFLVLVPLEVVGEHRHGGTQQLLVVDEDTDRVSLLILLTVPVEVSQDLPLPGKVIHGLEVDLLKPTIYLERNPLLLFIHVVASFHHLGLVVSVCRWEI